MHRPIDSPFANRFAKNFRHWRRWAARSRLTAYRVYDRDMPEYPIAVDAYGEHAHVSEYPRRKDLRGAAGGRRAEVEATLAMVMAVAPERIHWKTHVPAGVRGGQYERLARAGERLAVEENGLRFWVNLTDFLDTGLFLDHRNTRVRVRDEARGRRVLNLYAYTGSFTVYAAAGGAAATTTVDLSPQYLDWARDNLELNDLLRPVDRFVRADAAAFLEAEPAGSYELIVLDPPSFSTSRDMRGALDVQRDHPRLLAQALRLLAPGGVVYFSTNRYGFELKPRGLGAQFTELTPGSLPEDFTRKDSHRCWRVRPGEHDAVRGSTG